MTICCVAVGHVRGGLLWGKQSNLTLTLSFLPHIFAPHGWTVDQLRKLHACFKRPVIRIQDSDDIKNVLYTLGPQLPRYCIYVVLFCVIRLTLTQII